MKKLKLILMELDTNSIKPEDCIGKIFKTDNGLRIFNDIEDIIKGYAYSGIIPCDVILVDTKAKIKEGDLIYDKIPDDEGVLKEFVSNKNKGFQYMDTSTEVKVIASTNPNHVSGKKHNNKENIYLNYKPLPQLSEFSLLSIFYYYDLYKEIPEYVYIKDVNKTFTPKGAEIIHINIVDNNITLTWKEAELMLSSFICEYCPETSSKTNAGIFLNKWIKENK
jgi:hypothetical protein